MRKNKLFLLVIYFLPVLIIITSGCGKTKTDYAFLHEPSIITEIQIVAVNDSIFSKQGEIKQEVVCSINDIDTFLEDFAQLDCYNYDGYFCGPTEIGENATVIKMIYAGGEYELIDAGGQSKYENGKFKYYAGYYSFDKEQFDELITKYINK